MTSPTVSVVTVSYNAAATIQRTIESVLAQTYSQVEYLVIDGGSQDGTRDVLESYGTRLNFVSERDRGIYDAMNKGVAKAKGEWIHLLNADDWYSDPDALARAVPRLDANRTNYCDIERVYAHGLRVRQSLDVRRWMLFISAFLPHPGLFVSRGQYNAIGLYDTGFRIAADHDFLLRLTRRYPIQHVPVLLTCMDQGGLSAMDLNGSMSEFELVMRKNGMSAGAAKLLTAMRKTWWCVRAPRSTG